MEIFFDKRTRSTPTILNAFLLCETEVLFVRKLLELTCPIVLVQNIYEAMIENINIFDE